MGARTEITKKIDVQYVARLARLNLTDEEKKLFQKQLEDIVGYVHEIARLDVKDVQPLSSTAGSQNVLRPDEAKIGLPQQLVLKNAPLHDGQQFLVPKIV